MPSDLSPVTGIAGRYANALFELAREQDLLDVVAADLSQLRRLIDESEDLRRLVRSPVFGREEQTRAMQAVLQQGGADALTAKFVGLLTQNRRLFALSDIARAFAGLLAAHRGEVVADVSSAQALSDAQVQAIRAELAAALKTDVKVEPTVDESLLGGLVVRVGSRMIDSSLRTKLMKLKFAMKGAQ